MLPGEVPKEALNAEQTANQKQLGLQVGAAMLGRAMGDEGWRESLGLNKAAELTGQTRADLEESTVPNYGLDAEGRFKQSFGDFTAEVCRNTRVLFLPSESTAWEPLSSGFRVEVLPHYPPNNR